MLRTARAWPAARVKEWMALRPAATYVDGLYYSKALNGTELTPAPESSLWAPDCRVILAAKVPEQTGSTNGSDYKILMMKRAETMKFMPGVHVFPGGAVDPADRSEAWQSVLQGTGKEEYLADKIAAVRETFEECGILIALPLDKVAAIPAAELQMWRKQVHTDAAAFPRMCARLGIQPMLSALHEWSIWVTPTIETKRFFTRFYLAVLPSLPAHAAHDSLEATTTDWFRPEEGGPSALAAMQLYNQGQVKLIPPQWYTISELTTVRRHAQLADAARHRTVYPIQPEFTADDAGAALAALPGDPLHPDGARAPTDRHRILIKRMGKRGMDMGLECNLPGHPLAAAGGGSAAKL